MGIFSFFKEKPAPTAVAAKERLQVVIAHQRGDRTGSGDGPDYLPKLKEEILAVIRKYQKIDEEDVSVQLDKQDDCEVLELNITLNPD